LQNINDLSARELTQLKFYLMPSANKQRSLLLRKTKECLKGKQRIMLKPCRIELGLGGRRLEDKAKKDVKTAAAIVKKTMR
jgi:hypothetical protein